MADSQTRSQTYQSPQSTLALRKRIESLSPAQKQLFRQQIEAQGMNWAQVVGEPASTSKLKQSELGQVRLGQSELTPRPDKLPLSDSQKQLWVFHQLNPDTSAYHIAFMLTLKGNLVESALRQSLQDIVNRHESLRTVFLQENNRPYAKVLSGVEITLPVIGLRCDDETETELKIKQWQESLVKTPFDLEQGPLIRIQLLERASNHFELILVLHHLIADGWSRGILLRELAGNYRNHLEERTIVGSVESAFPALEIQYADHVLQQQEWLKGEQCAQHRAYWKQQLADVSELNLPSDRQRSLHFASQTCTRTFSLVETNAIKALAKQSGATVFMLLLAIFKLLLHRYSNQSDIAVGVPVAGRSSAKVESLIGFFVNTLVIRSHVDSELSFPAWLKQVQATLSDALQHQDIPFPEVVEAVGAARVAGKNPLFRVMFQVQSSGYQLQNAESLSPSSSGAGASGAGLLGEMPGLSLSQQWIEPGETKFDMSWHIIERDGQLLSAVEYRMGLFERDRVQTMLDSFHTLVSQAVATPDQQLCQFSLLSDSEKEQILTQWSQKGALSRLLPCLPAKFEEQVEKTPDVIAVHQVATENNPQKSLTYQHLNHKANKIAHWLRSEGIDSGCLVGICLSPGPDLIAALLATIKAGGVYVPLDPSLPADRLRYMVKDAKPTVLVANRNCLPSGLAEEIAASVLYLDTEEHLIAQPGHNLSISIQPEDLAYVIYTSGSTGKPKGTQLTHGGLINYLNWCLSAYPVSEGCGALVQSSVGFDATITSLFAPLLAGKQVVFQQEATEVESLLEALSGEFSFIKLTPSHLSALQPLLNPQVIDRSRLPKALIIGGEALHSHHISLWQEHFPEVSLFNEYGPTEAVVGCCVHQVTSEDRGNIPIGTPINGVQLYVLDEQKQPVPAGVPGELYVGGAGVAQGYLNRSTLTAERFISNPFATAGNEGDMPGSTLYKTGDLVAYRTDGSLEYLGRIDSQIKLRGFRIEPGEIEQALTKHSQVSQAAVVLREVENKRELAAYVVTKKSANNKLDKSDENITADLRQYLNQVLPSYMVPAHIVSVDALPLTANGKLDQSKLPAPHAERGSQKSVQPRNRKEAILLEVWNQILNTPDISIYDNFFDLGGDSISGMQIVSKARSQGLQLTPTQLFQHQTIAEQAVIATEIASTDTEASSQEIPEGNIPFSPIQWDFFEQNLPEPHHYNQSLLLSVQPNLNVAALQTALNTLVSHHDALRLRFKQSESGWQQHYAPESQDDVPLEEVSLLASEQLKLNEIIANFQASLNLEKGPLFRSILLHLEQKQGNETDKLLLVTHHLVVDGVSWRVLLSDVATAYAQAEAKQAISLPARTASFGAWTQYLNQHLNQQDFETALNHWSTVCRQQSHLPVEIASGQNTIADEQESVISLASKETEKLKKLPLSIDVLLLTTLSQTLGQWSSQWNRQPSLVIDMEGHGRQLPSKREQSQEEHLDLSRTVGWFTCVYPLHLSLPSDSLTEQVDYVSQQLNLVPHQGISYGLLRLQHHDNDAQLASPAEVSFNYLGQIDKIADGIDLLQKIEAAPASRCTQANRRYLFDIVAVIQNEQLQVKWRYSQKQYQHSTIEQLTQRFISHLSSLIAHYSHAQEPASDQAEAGSQDTSQAPSQGQSSFSAARVDSSQLNQLMDKLQRRGGKRS